MKPSPDLRKLFLYAKDDNFANKIDIATINAFINSNEIQVKQMKHISELEAKPEGQHFILGDWPCVLERTTPLRKFSTLVAGVV